MMVTLPALTEDQHSLLKAALILAAYVSASDGLHQQAGEYHRLLDLIKEKSEYEQEDG